MTPMSLHNCIFDWKRTLYDPDKDNVIEGAFDVLQLLADNKIPCVLIGKGGADMEKKLAESGLEVFFEQALFSGAEKNPELFDLHMNRYEPHKTLIVGDRARSEIEIGNRLGATTIWVRQGKFADEEPLTPEQKADFVVNNLQELYTLLDKFGGK